MASRDAGCTSRRLSKVQSDCCLCGVTLQLLMGMAMFFIGLSAFSSLVGFNLTTSGVVEEVLPKQDSLWLCEAIVTLPEENHRNVTVDFRCPKQDQVRGKQLEVCYKSIDPTQASINAPSWAEANFGAGELPGSKVSYHMGCSFYSLQTATRLVLAFWVMFFIVLVILIAQISMYLCYSQGASQDPCKSTTDVELGHLDGHL